VTHDVAADRLEYDAPKACNADEVNVYEAGGKGVRLVDVDGKKLSAVMTTAGEPFTVNLLVAERTRTQRPADPPCDHSSS
jgi:hypothetical protein